MRFICWFFKKMKIDGKKIALKIKKELKEKIKKDKIRYRLCIILVDKNEASECFIKAKKQFAKDVGIEVSVYEFKRCVSANVIKNKIQKLNEDKDCMGIIIQLPLPKHLPVEEILNTVSIEKDVDVLGERALFEFAKNKNFKRLPAVVGAIQEIFLEYNIKQQQDTNIVIIGSGRLVGRPISLWFDREKKSYKIIDEKTADKFSIIKMADVIISGVGVPHMIVPKNIKEDAIIIDAGTSKKGEMLFGDVHPDCEQKASLMTPVPGGVGPVTVAILFRNLITNK